MTVNTARDSGSDHAKSSGSPATQVIPNLYITDLEHQQRTDHTLKDTGLLMKPEQINRSSVV